MSAEAKSSKGTRMWLSQGGATGTTVIPTAISKSNPAKVTAPDPGPSPAEPITILGLTPGATTTFAVSGSDWDKVRDQVTFSGLSGDWTVLNGSQDVVRGAAGSNVFSAAVDSSAFADPPEPDTIGAIVAGRPRSFAIGQVVYCENTGFAELDGKAFTIAEVVPEGFTLRGADTSHSIGTIGWSPTMVIYMADELISMCLNNFAFSLETPGTIAAGTYCNPSATLPAVATGAGTATLGGWIDVDDPAYAELIAAESDGLRRTFVIGLPLNQGEIIAPLTISGITWDIPLEGGMAFTATAALGSRPRHLF